MSTGRTPSQTSGPYVDLGLVELPHEARSAGDAVHLTGSVFDGAGQLVHDVVLEFWSVEPVEHRGVARRASIDDSGRYHVTVPRPQAVVNGETPYVLVFVIGGGLLRHLTTRAYIVDDAGAVPPEVTGLTELQTRSLLASRAGGEHRFDIRLQGHDETVFFDV